MFSVQACIFCAINACLFLCKHLHIISVRMLMMIKLQKGCKSVSGKPRKEQAMDTSWLKSTLHLTKRWMSRRAAQLVKFLLRSYPSHDKLAHCSCPLTQRRTFNKIKWGRTGFLQVHFLCKDTAKVAKKI